MNHSYTITIIWDDTDHQYIARCLENGELLAGAGVGWSPDNAVEAAHDAIRRKITSDPELWWAK